MQELPRMHCVPKDFKMVTVRMCSGVTKPLEIIVISLFCVYFFLYVSML